MPRMRSFVAALLVLIPVLCVLAPSAARAETRIALVIGNAAYQAGELKTAANDAGLPTLHETPGKLASRLTGASAGLRAR